jgi:hypothetical protein
MTECTACLPDEGDYRFRPRGTPHPELLLLGYDEERLEAVSRIQQLAESLANGTIGFEWFTHLSRIELARIGW